MGGDLVTGAGTYVGIFAIGQQTHDKGISFMSKEQKRRSKGIR